MASREYVTGLGAQRPYDQGLTEAKLAAYALLGKAAPPYVALDALPVTRDNLLKGGARYPSLLDSRARDPPPRRSANPNAANITGEE